MVHRAVRRRLPNVPGELKKVAHTRRGFLDNATSRAADIFPYPVGLRWRVVEVSWLVLRCLEVNAF